VAGALVVGEPFARIDLRKTGRENQLHNLAAKQGRPIMQSRKFDGSVRPDGMKKRRAFKNVFAGPTGVSTAFHTLTRLLFISIFTAAIVFPAAAQSNNSHEAAAASFQGLGQMPGVWPAAGTYASAMSSDGSTIMGYGWVCFNGGTKCNTSGSVQAYKWTAAGGYQVLGSKGNSDFFGAGAVSSNGSVIVGEHPLGNNTSQAFRWTAANGLAQLPMLIADAVTSDGAMVAGGDSWWNSGKTGTFGFFAGNENQTEAYGLAGTGKAPIAVGAAIQGSDVNGPAFHAFLWTPSAGLEDLGVTTGTQSIGIAVSANGQVVVGEALDASGFWRAFRWTAATGMQDIGTLGGPESAAFAVNGDGSVIVGSSLTTGESDSNHCFIWTEAEGMQDMKAVLDTAGVHTADPWITLDSLIGISADGTVMVGYGQSPKTTAFPFGQFEPFRVVLPAL
jgi:probable HAF family extracellular repeat protein